MSHATGKAMSKDILFTARASVFGFPVREHKFLLEPDGSILAWSDVAGHYTRCHSLPEKTLERLRKIGESLVQVGPDTYQECDESDLPHDVRWDVPPNNQGQTIEVAYGDSNCYRHLFCAGDAYRRVTDLSDRSSITYYRLVK